MTESVKTEPLFRPEVLDARRRSWLGGISLAQPLSLWALTGFAVLAAAAIIAFLIFGEYTQRSRVVGQLVPDLGLSIVVAPSAGVLTQRMPEEGERVTRNQRLAVIVVPRATTADGDMATGLREGLSQRRVGIERGYRSQDQLLAAQSAGVARQLASAREELTQIQAQTATRQRQATLSRETLARFRSLAAQHYISEVQSQQQEQASLEQLAGAQALQQQASAAQRTIAQLEQSLRELPAQQSAQSAARERDLAQLEGERLQTEANGEVLVQAPVAGMVASRLIQPGQSVQAGEPLLSLLPAGSQLQAQLLVPSSAVGFIAPGDSVLLRYQAYPYQKFGHYQGKVARISRSALSPGELGTLIGNAQAGEPYYRVIVDLSNQSVTAYGKAEPLRPGMMLEADILGERRKLYEWVLEPLYSLHGKL
ncbi:MAG TPA: HlyD family efflux transporter periplasmic adaptor subunit [Xanthomonadaceae bacterium]|jgi:membrane fusion protein|nr:HlyD family efflux transporter periplasmic adaptor subunit [Xanthomonadaceae bacterium]